MTPDGVELETRFHREVLELHRYLGDWLRGDVPRPGRGPTRLAHALADGFLLINPRGICEGKPEVIRNFTSAFGTRTAGYAIEIDDLLVRVIGDGIGLVMYRESHRGEPGRTRISTAVLRRASDDESIEWLSLQETSLAR